MTAAYSKALAECSYAIVDRVAVHDLPEDLQLIGLIPPALEDSAALMPALLDLKTLNDEQRQLYGERLGHETLRKQPLLFSAFLHTEANRYELTSHLEKALILDRGTNGRSYFRFFDPRVFIQLEWLWDGRQWGELLGPIDRWSYGLDGHWGTAQRDALIKSGAPTSDINPMITVAWLDAINEAIALAAPESLDARQTSGKLAADLLVVAQRRFGLRQGQDIALFLAHGLRIHPRFYDHPWIRRSLQALPEESDLPYCAIAAELDDESFDRIRADMNRILGIRYE
jgi:hypothetical protein